MVNIKWCASPNDGDCLAAGEWDTMVAYIKHSGVVDFTIYGSEGTCTDTGQAFKFSQTGVLSKMYGGADAGDDMTIFANSSDLCSLIQLLGDGDIVNKIEESSSFRVSTCTDEALLVVSASALTYKGTNICLAPCGGSAACPVKGDLPFTLWNDCTAEDEKGFQFKISGDTSTIEGSDDTGDILILKANSTDTWPYILLDGDDFALVNVASYFEIQDQGEQMFKFDHSSPTSYLYGSDDTGDDLLILANETDDCATLMLFGNGGVRSQIKNNTGIFEVSTCSDERLFDIFATDGDKHMDFHCLDANNFVLENRTDDPVSPCTGQMWFRTDLV